MQNIVTSIAITKWRRERPDSRVRQMDIDKEYVKRCKLVCFDILPVTKDAVDAVVGSILPIQGRINACLIDL